MKFGVVTNCRFADVKKEPRIGAETLFTVPLGTKIAVDADTSRDGYYNVFLENGTNGYCVRRFVKIIK